MKKFLAFASVMIFAAAANAGVMVNVIENAPPVAGTQSFTLQLVGEGSDTIAGFRDVSFPGVHQVWSSSPSPPNGRTAHIGEIAGDAFLDQNLVPTDSHFLFDFGDDSFILGTEAAFDESNDFTNPGGLPVDGGPIAGFDQRPGLGDLFVTTTGGGYGILGGTPSMDFAQIVILEGSSVNYSIAANYFPEGNTAGGNVAQMLTGTLGGTTGMGELTAGDDLFFGGPLGSTMMAQFTNTGDADLTISGIALEDENPADVFTFAPLSGDVTLAPDETLDVEVTLDSVPPGTTPGTIATANLVATSDVGSAAVGLAAAIPEPSTFALAGLALVGLVGFARRR